MTFLSLKVLNLLSALLCFGVTRKHSGVFSHSLLHFGKRGKDVFQREWKYDCCGLWLLMILVLSLAQAYNSSVPLPFVQDNYRGVVIYVYGICWLWNSETYSILSLTYGEVSQVLMFKTFDSWILVNTCTYKIAFILAFLICCSHHPCVLTNSLILLNSYAKWNDNSPKEYHCIEGEVHFKW